MRSSLLQVQQSFCHQTSREMDLREEVQKLLDEDPNMDEGQTDMMKAAACLIVAAVKMPRKGGSEEKGRVCE